MECEIFFRENRPYTDAVYGIHSQPMVYLCVTERHKTLIDRSLYLTSSLMITVLSMNWIVRIPTVIVLIVITSTQDGGRVDGR